MSSRLAPVGASAVGSAALFPLQHRPASASAPFPPPHCSGAATVVGVSQSFY